MLAATHTPWVAGTFKQVFLQIWIRKCKTRRTGILRVALDNGPGSIKQACACGMHFRDNIHAVVLPSVAFKNFFNCRPYSPETCMICIKHGHHVIRIAAAPAQAEPI